MVQPMETMTALVMLAMVVALELGGQTIADVGCKHDILRLLYFGYSDTSGCSTATAHS